jgi:hypothetical protein
VTFLDGDGFMARDITDRIDRLAAQKQAALEKARNIDAKLRKLRSEQDRMARISARKERNRALIQAGILVESVGLLHTDRGTLLGGLVALAKIVEGNAEMTQKWKEAGDAEIARRVKGKTKKAESDERPGRCHSDRQNTRRGE